MLWNSDDGDGRSFGNDFLASLDATELLGLRRSVRESAQAIDSSLVVCINPDFLQRSSHLGCIFKGQSKLFQFSVVHNLVFTNVEDLSEDFLRILCVVILKKTNKKAYKAVKAGGVAKNLMSRPVTRKMATWYYWVVENKNRLTFQEVLPLIIWPCHIVLTG
jgi:hypothetical protein